MKTTRTILGGAILAFALMLSGPAWAQADIDFGDDTSTWANDGECDDPRFSGEGAASVTSPVDQGRDAADCQAAYEAGTVTFVGEAPAASAPETGDIDFGDDSGTWANDGECDDPRFGGTLDDHLMADAADCRTAYEAGDVTYDPSNEISGAVQIAGDIDFGDDSGTWANDGECDDPRFGGMLDSHEMADATDCQTAYEAGEVTYLGEGGAMTDEVDFGDDSGEWANDGECDDPRFEGDGMGVALDSHYMADASDCEAAYTAGTITLAGEGGNGDTSVVGDIDFGDDSGQWANDGECDDPRFEGDGMGVAMGSHTMADASDCQAAFNDGAIVFVGDEAATAPIIIDGIDFGDDSGNWANDGECDDPRFEGSGVGVALDDHRMADATDCSAAYQDGTVTLAADGGNGDVRINFGDDSGEYANDGECDDPRFEGPGMFETALDDHLMADASDCQAAYNEGTVTLVGEGGDDVRINFGDDSSDAAFDGVCDDPRFVGRGGAPELFAHNALADATDCRNAYDAGTVTYDPQ